MEEMNDMERQAAELSQRLAQHAEAVCHHYLSNGRRAGQYWIAGDVRNSPGRSLFVRLCGPEAGPGAASKWTDAATGEHGDLLDLIRLNRNFPRLVEAFDEARAFLALPRPDPPSSSLAPVPAKSPAAACRLFRASRPLAGTLAEAYLRARGIAGALDWPALRFHPSAYYRECEGAPLQTWPALLAAVTGHDGAITAVQRTWLDPHRPAKAPLTDPRRAMGHLLGNGVRFGTAEPAPGQAVVLAAGEGVETMLSLKDALPLMPMIAALSANHLAALDPAPAWRRLYVARDSDAAGLHAANKLRARATAAGIDVRDLLPAHKDFNLDLSRLGADGLRAHVAPQLDPDDRARFLPH
jgi:Toprim domain